MSTRGCDAGPRATSTSVWAPLVAQTRSKTTRRDREVSVERLTVPTGAPSTDTRRTPRRRLVGATNATSRPVNRSVTLEPIRDEDRIVPAIAVRLRIVVQDPDQALRVVRSPYIRGRTDPIADAAFPAASLAWTVKRVV